MLQIIGDIYAVGRDQQDLSGQSRAPRRFRRVRRDLPGTDGLLHISEIAENRIKQVRDELKEGDQILVKVLALEGNKIKLSRKAVLKEQREKLKNGRPGLRSRPFPRSPQSRNTALPLRPA